MAKPIIEREESLRDLDEDSKNALRWIAAEYNYLKELKDDLELLKQDIVDFKKEKDHAALARRLTRYVGKCERRAMRYENKIDNDIKN